MVHETTVRFGIRQQRCWTNCRLSLWRRIRYEFCNTSRIEIKYMLWTSSQGCSALRHENETFAFYNVFLLRLNQRDNQNVSDGR